MVKKFVTHAIKKIKNYNFELLSSTKPLVELMILFIPNLFYYGKYKIKRFKSRHIIYQTFIIILLGALLYSSTPSLLISENVNMDELEPVINVNSIDYHNSEVYVSYSSRNDVISTLSGENYAFNSRYHVDFKILNDQLYLSWSTNQVYIHFLDTGNLTILEYEIDDIEIISEHTFAILSDYDIHIFSILENNEILETKKIDHHEPIQGLQYFNSELYFSVKDEVRKYSFEIEEISLVFAWNSGFIPMETTIKQFQIGPKRVVVANDTELRIFDKSNRLVESRQLSKDQQINQIIFLDINRRGYENEFIVVTNQELRYYSHDMTLFRSFSFTAIHDLVTDGEIIFIKDARNIVKLTILPYMTTWYQVLFVISLIILINFMFSPYIEWGIRYFLARKVAFIKETTKEDIPIIRTPRGIGLSLKREFTLFRGSYQSQLSSEFNHIIDVIQSHSQFNRSQIYEELIIMDNFVEFDLKNNIQWLHLSKIFVKSEIINLCDPNILREFKLHRIDKVKITIDEKTIEEIEKSDITIFSQIEPNHLDLSNNHLKSIDWIGINKKTRLLTLSHNKLSNEVFSELNNIMINIKFTLIDLSYNKFKSKDDNLLDLQGRISKVKSINLSNNNIHKITLDENHDVEVLNLSHNKLTGDFTFNKINNLKKLDLSHNNFKENFEINQQLLLLKSLRLEFNDIDNLAFYTSDDLVIPRGHLIDIHLNYTNVKYYGFQRDFNKVMSNVRLHITKENQIGVFIDPEDIQIEDVPIFVDLFSSKNNLSVLRIIKSQELEKRDISIINRDTSTRFSSCVQDDRCIMISFNPIGTKY